MHFLPYNRHLVVNLVEDEESEDNSLIVLPSDYEKPLSPYARAMVVEVAKDSKFHAVLNPDDRILVERRMLHKIEIGEYSFYLILENYIFGRFDT